MHGSEQVQSGRSGGHYKVAMLRRHSGEAHRPDDSKLQHDRQIQDTDAGASVEAGTCRS